MGEMRNVKNSNLLITGVALAAVIFITDIYTPRGIADAISYVALVLLTLWSSRKSHTIIAAIGGTILTVSGLAFSPAGEVASIFLANRFLAIIGIWVAAFVILRFKESEKKNQQMRDSLNALFNYATEGIIITDKDGIITLVNPEAEKQFGYDPEELLGKSIDILVPDRVAGRHRGHREQFMKHGDSRAMGVGMELWGKRKDNSEFPVEISLSSYKLDQQQQTVVFVIDITERKKRQEEINRTHEELKKYAAMLKDTNAELESFAYISSHDLQEPLRKIQSFGGRVLAGEHDKLSDDGKDYLTRVLNAAARMQSLINDLLTFSRLTTRSKTSVEVDLNVVAAEVMQDMEVTIAKNNARIVVDPLPRVVAEPTQMRQLFQNLLVNAIKFRKADVDPVIHISAGRVDFNGHDYHELRFEDNGIGFNEKYAEKIFGIFQRLEGSRYEGSGIGLTICKKIVSRHGGAISVKSTPGKGSVFLIRLPLHPIALTPETYDTNFENN